MQEMYGDQIMLALITAWFIEKIKKSTWFPWLTAKTEKLNQGVSAVIAALSTAGILVAAGWDVSSHTFTLSVAGLTVSNIATFVWQSFGQYLLMKFAYKFGMKDEKALPQ